jgi:hypothetical protein
MFIKGPSTFHNFKKITIQETPLKAFLTLTCITIQARCKSRRILMPKRMGLIAFRVDIPN